MIEWSFSEEKYREIIKYAYSKAASHTGIWETKQKHIPNIGTNGSRLTVDPPRLIPMGTWATLG
jgi:hypothetical protein